MRWVNLEPVIQSEVSQKEKNKYHILTCIYGDQKSGISINKPSYREEMEMQIQIMDLS